MLFLRRTRHRATFQMFRVVVLLPERFRGGCSFGAGTRVPVSSNDLLRLRHGTLKVKQAESEAGVAPCAYNALSNDPA